MKAVIICLHTEWFIIFFLQLLLVKQCKHVAIYESCHSVVSQVSLKCTVWQSWHVKPGHWQEDSSGGLRHQSMTHLAIKSIEFALKRRKKERFLVPLNSVTCRMLSKVEIVIKDCRFWLINQLNIYLRTCLRWSICSQIVFWFLQSLSEMQNFRTV